MYKVLMHKKEERSSYNVTLSSKNKDHYINIIVSNENDAIAICISKSEDGFYFTSPCDESSDLELSSSHNLEDTYNYVKKHFVDKEYEFSTF